MVMLFKKVCEDVGFVDPSGNVLNSIKVKSFGSNILVFKILCRDKGVADDILKGYKNIFNADNSIIDKLGENATGFAEAFSFEDSFSPEDNSLVGVISLDSVSSKPSFQDSVKSLFGKVWNSL